ncbi:hypothetical protein JW872_01200 [Candidatus Babeliales bacterium]|nr:hypothetical protein [Candidatus Babeliales bacterium]
MRRFLFSCMTMIVALITLADQQVSQELPALHERLLLFIERNSLFIGALVYLMTYDHFGDWWGNALQKLFAVRYLMVLFGSSCLVKYLTKYILGAVHIPEMDEELEDVAKKLLYYTA